MLQIAKHGIKVAVYSEMLSRKEHSNAFPEEKADIGDVKLRRVTKSSMRLK